MERKYEVIEALEEMVPKNRVMEIRYAASRDLLLDVTNYGKETESYLIGNLNDPVIFLKMRLKKLLEYV